MHCSIQLFISDLNTLKCSIIKEDETEEIITLNNDLENNLENNSNTNIQQQYPIMISFTKNEVIICQKISYQNQNEIIEIEFMNDWIQFPNKYKKYPFTFQGKQYNAIAEVFFALIINEFKNKITKKYIIDDCYVEIPSNDYTLIRRIKVSLESIGLNNIFVNNDIEFDYEEQGDILHDVIKQNDEFRKYKQKIKSLHESFEGNMSEDTQSLLKSIETNEFSETLMYEMGLQFTTKQKEQMKLYPERHPKKLKLF